MKPDLKLVDLIHLKSSILLPRSKQIVWKKEKMLHLRDHCKKLGYTACVSISEIDSEK